MCFGLVFGSCVFGHICDDEEERCFGFAVGCEEGVPDAWGLFEIDLSILVGGEWLGVFSGGHCVSPMLAGVSGAMAVAAFCPASTAVLWLWHLCLATSIPSPGRVTPAPWPLGVTSLIAH